MGNQKFIKSVIWFVVLGMVITTIASLFFI